MDDAVMDGYSRTVVAVAATVRPRVVAIRSAHGAGSAVVWTAEGALLTTAHTVATASGGTLTYHDGSEAAFTVLGADPLSDLAVLATRGGAPEPARFGDADELALGQLVVTVGSPQGLAGSVAAGVIGALGRALPVSSRRAGRIIEDVVQTDTVHDPGNTGGALADTRGRVVGIATSVAGVGVGLAVPLNATTLRIATELRERGHCRRAYLGLVGAPATVPGRDGGVRVIEVVRDAPAERAGLRRGDVVLSVDGEAVRDAQGIQRHLFAEAVGRPTPVCVLRGGTLVEIVTVPIEPGV